MRVLLVNDRRSERESLLKALPQASYQVEAVADEAQAIAAMAREAPQVLVLAAPPRGGDELVRRLRSFDSSGQAYFVAILDGDASHEDICNLLDAGVNDFLRRPVFEAELIERVKAPPRLIRWVKSIERPLAFDFSAPTDVAKLRGYQNLGFAAAEDLGQIIGHALVVTAGMPAAFGAGARSATIPMSLVNDRIEVRVSVAVDGRTAEWLKGAVLGDPSASEAMIDDVLRELANTAGGALKRSALGENVTLTTGIPFNEELATTSNQVAWTLALPEVGVRLVVVSAIHSKENQRVVATHLSEGMVVVHDLRNAGGLLLVPAGSRLTSSTAAKLAKVLGPKFFLEVAPAA